VRWWPTTVSMNEDMTRVVHLGALPPQLTNDEAILSPFSTKHLLFITLLSGFTSAACESGGVGDPCIPEDEYKKNFNGHNENETSVESQSYQCESRICLAVKFRGRVSCPYGQPGGSSVAGVAMVAPGLDADDYCYLPGTKKAEENRVRVPVEPQLLDRSPDKAVYCSCRCDGPDKNRQYCDCPGGYVCQKLVDAYETHSRQKLIGSYCIKDGTQVGNTAEIDQTTCDSTGPTYGPRPGGCGLDKHPAGI
jgi:hypothetical protein